MTDGDGGMAGILRERFASTDLAEVEEYFCASYADITMTLDGDASEFALQHETVAGGGIALSRMRNSLSWTCTMAPLGDALIVEHVHSGRLRWRSDRFGDVGGAAGSTTLLPPADEITNVTDEADLSIVGLDTGGLQQYAAAVCGVEDLEFTDLTPVSDRARDHWLATVAHVRDAVLADPEVAGSPLVVDDAFRLLAAAALSTFPNTAQMAATDPSGPAARGAVDESVLRDVVDYLHTHADRPLRPDEVAAIAEVPVRAVDRALRRSRNTTAARELWRARLAGARRELDHADPRSGVTVAGVAVRWGFANRRSFTAAYTSAFAGETPEQTLRR